MDFLNQINNNHETIYTLLRALIIYLYAILLIRFNRRLHIETSFDFVFIIMIGAILERGIFLDTSTFLMSIGVSFLLVLAHKLISYLTFFSKDLGKIFKGRPVTLYQHNRFNRKIMETQQITEEDIMEACRRDLQCDNLDRVLQINLERTGKISFIKK